MRGGSLLVALVLIVGCTQELVPPEVGDTWQIDAVDRSGTFGSITIERGEVIRLPAGSDADIFLPGASHGVLVHMTYEPARPSDSGFGSFDWDGRVPPPGASRIMGLVSGVNWPVEGTLPTKLPGAADSIAGWMVIPVTEADLRQPITLVYQPIIADAGNGDRNPQVVTELVVHAP
jgi:hypothetical protein